MTVNWNLEYDHLISRWSNGEDTLKYDFGWMEEADAGEEQRCTHAVDFTRLSPFGGAKWYNHALRDPLKSR